LPEETIAFATPPSSQAIAFQATGGSAAKAAFITPQERPQLGPQP
jgi:hypothetical protein